MTVAPKTLKNYARSAIRIRSLRCEHVVDVGHTLPFGRDIIYGLANVAYPRSGKLAFSSRWCGDREARPVDPRLLFRSRLKVISKLLLLHVSAPPSPPHPPTPSAGVSKPIPVKNDQTVLKVTAEK